MLEEPRPAEAPQDDDPDHGPPAAQAHLRSLEERFRSTLGTKVSLDRRQNGSGRLVIHFYSDDDLEQIYRRIVGEKHDL